MYTIPLTRLNLPSETKKQAQIQIYIDICTIYYIILPSQSPSTETPHSCSRAPDHSQAKKEVMGYQIHLPVLAALRRKANQFALPPPYIGW